MNRTHLEGAAEKLTAQRGYTFYTGPEGDMGHTVRNYPRHGWHPRNCTPSKGVLTDGRPMT